MNPPPQLLVSASTAKAARRIQGLRRRRAWRAPRDTVAGAAGSRASTAGSQASAAWGCGRATEGSGERRRGAGTRSDLPASHLSYFSCIPSHSPPVQLWFFSMCADLKQISEPGEDPSISWFGDAQQPVPADKKGSSAETPCQQRR
jgi:hypothetical protein